ncbi:MAG: FGGY-family carbohydrate kinase [Candidatus Caldatribacteriaceae bacterium]
MALLGIDIGTTNTKLKVYDEEGRTLEEQSFPTPLLLDADGPYYDAERLFVTLCESMQGFSASIRQRIHALSVSSFAEVVVGLSEDGAPLNRCIPWYDERTKEQIATLNLDPSWVYRTTGLSPHHKYSLYKLLWHRHHERELFERVRHWTSMAGYVLFALSGELSFDYSLASRTMLFDQHHRRWSEELLKVVGIPQEKMSPLYPSGVTLGTVKKEVAQKSGLPKNTFVVTGGHDHLCAALASGVFQKCWGLISTGTTESLTIPLEEPPSFPEESGGKPFSFGHHVVFPLYYALGGIYSGGYSVDWLLRLLGESYRLFGGTEIRLGRSTPLFFPYLLGGEYEEARGAFLNLWGETDKKDLALGVLCGLCAEYRIIWERMEKELSYKVDHAVNVGGGVQNKTWMSLKATFLGRPVVVPEEKEGSCQGAALLAGIGAGIYKSPVEVFQRTFRIREVFEPLENLKEEVHCFFETYRSVRGVLKEANVHLARGFEK